MKSLKSKRIFVLIWVVLSISALASVYTFFKGLSSFDSNPLIFWMTLVKFIIMGILMLMSLNLWKIVNSYTEKNKWKPLFYQKVRQIGYWALVLTLFNAIFQSGYETIWSSFANTHVDLSVVFLIRRLYAILLMESPAMWVLTLSIFLFAELLQIANQFKTENESFI